jgi:hypothetical protein
MLTAVAVVFAAGPAFAQSGGSGGSGGSHSSAGGSSASGSSSSSAAVNTSGSSVGVVQGNVAEGSSTSGTSSDGDGSQSGSSQSGSGVGGQTVGSAGAPNAAKDGVLRQLDLPAMNTARNATPASSSRPDMLLVWAAAAVLLMGLAVLYRRLPRPTSV